MMFITENVPSRLKGILTKWMLQLKPGVFIGTLSTLVGERLWNKIQEKQGDGGAVWVKGTNNEQKFKIYTSGLINWKVNDFDGLQLITHPRPKKRKRKNKNEKITKTKNKTRSKSLPINYEFPPVTWDTCKTPDNFIVRNVQIRLNKSQITTEFSGSSSFGEYPPHKLWCTPYSEDIKRIGESLLKYILDLEQLPSQPFYNQKIACIDIETTDYLPKAYEGFVNIISVALLDLCVIEKEKIKIEIIQTFNMHRKKHDAPILLSLIYPHLQDIDKLLVFNKDFDIKILKRIINEFSLKIELPNSIIDLQKYFPRLKDLEFDLEKRVKIKRNTTKKGKYSDYYKLFKGKGKAGKDKKIEPIGTYNICDSLTPLYMYLLLNTNKKSDS